MSPGTRHRFVVGLFLLATGVLTPGVTRGQDLFVANSGSFNNSATTLSRFNSAGVAQTITLSAAINFPQGLVSSGVNTLYATDPTNNRIQRISISGTTGTV